MAIVAIESYINVEESSLSLKRNYLIRQNVIAFNFIYIAMLSLFILFSVIQFPLYNIYGKMS